MTRFLGQTQVVETLQRLAERDALGHSVAITGPSGMGKIALARALAAQLLCQTAKGGTPCGECAACKTFMAGTHPDFLQIDPEKNRIPIDKIRAMQDHLLLRRVYGKKVYLITDADRMTPEAQNCLLKTLEEPPEGTHIIMTVTAFDTLLMTVRSRTVRYALSRYTHDEVRRILQLERNAAPAPDEPVRKGAKGAKAAEAAPAPAISSTTVPDFLIDYAQGVPGRALELLESRTLAKSRELALNAVLEQGGRVDALDPLHTHLGEEPTLFLEVLDILQGIYRDLLLLGQGVTDGLINSDKQDMMKKHVHRDSPEMAMRAVMALDALRNAASGNLNASIATDTLMAGLAGKWAGWEH